VISFASEAANAACQRIVRIGMPNMSGKSGTKSGQFATLRRARVSYSPVTMQGSRVPLCPLPAGLAAAQAWLRTRGVPGLARRRVPPAGPTEHRAAMRFLFLLLLVASTFAAGPVEAQAAASQPSHAQATVAQPAAARPTGAGALGADLVAQVRAFSLAATARWAGQARLDVQLGRLDPRLRLAPCERIEPYLPPGQRLWGRSRIGLRCLQGAVRWNVFLPVTVRVYAPALVAAVPLPVGHTVKAEDLKVGEVDLTAGTATTEAGDLIGRSLRRPLSAGDAVLAEALNARRWFEAGERVELVALGRGYRVSSAGEALMPGLDGRVVRIRTESGRVVAGRAVAPHQVEVSL
jgi:flagella basal body P-ring formation protein FlgA